jgi:type I thyroxine 5'-deiodinase
MKLLDLEQALLDSQWPHADRPRLVHVYIREAHPSDEWQMAYNNPSAEHPEGICVQQPKSIAERIAIARRMREDNALRAPIVCDGVDNALDRLLAACPDRLYVLKEGRMVWKGGQGPFLYSTAELLNFLGTRA